MTQLIFESVIYKRSIENVIPKYVRDLINKNLELIEFMSWFIPETKEDEKLARYKLAEYKDNQRELHEFGFKNVIPKMNKPFSLQKQRTETLKNLNNELLEKIETVDLKNIGEIKLDIKKFLRIQEILESRNKTYFGLFLNHENYLRIRLLLGNRCSNCGKYNNLTIHHITPFSCGGTNEIQNLIILCRDCHDLEHHMIKFGFSKFKEYKQFIKHDGVC